MGSLSGMHWIVLLVVVLILFGAGRLPRVMGDFAKGIKAFKAGMQDEEAEAASVPPTVAGPAVHAAAPAAPVQPPAAAATVVPGVAPSPGAAHPGQHAAPTDYRTGSAA